VQFYTEQVAHCPLRWTLICLLETAHREAQEREGKAGRGESGARKTLQDPISWKE
jgi:hypothetical protein